MGDNGSSRGHHVGTLTSANPKKKKSFGNEGPKTIMHQLVDPPRSVPQLTDPHRSSSQVNRGTEEGEKLKLDWALLARLVGTNLQI